MNPINVPSTDYGLYYNHSYMLHQELGVVEVLASGGNLSVRKVGRRMERRIVHPETLQCMWPINMSLNTTRGAIYVARRAVRSARRTATLEHYYIAWQDMAGNASVSANILKKMNNPPEYPTLDRACDTIDSAADYSVAISRDIILARSATAGYEVICSGETAGTLEVTEEGTTFTALQDASPYSKRAAFKLQKEGFLCQ